MKVFLGEVRLIRAGRHFGYQGPSRIGKGLPGSPVSIGGIPNGLLHLSSGVFFTLFDQFERPHVIAGVPSQYIHGRDRLGVGVHCHRCLMAVESLATALSTVPHLGVVDRGDTVSAHPLLQCRPFLLALHILQQQLPQQLGRLYDLLALRAVYRESPLTPAGQFQQPISIGHNLLEESLSLFLVVPV